MKENLKTEFLNHENLKEIEVIQSSSVCVRIAREAVLRAAREYNLDISSGGSDFDVMMDMYMRIYTDCLNN